MCPQIVLVEDDAELCGMLRHALQDAGCDVHAFCDANEAWDAVGSMDALDLLIADLSFPAGQANGISVSLNATTHHVGVSVIYITARQDLADITRERGYPVLLKPFTLVTFIQMVQGALEDRRLATLLRPSTEPEGHLPYPPAPAPSGKAPAVS